MIHILPMMKKEVWQDLGSTWQSVSSPGGETRVLKHGAPVESNVPLQNVIQVWVLRLNLRNAGTVISKKPSSSVSFCPQQEEKTSDLIVDVELNSLFLLTIDFPLFWFTKIESNDIISSKRDTDLLQLLLWFFWTNQWRRICPAEFKSSGWHCWIHPF